MLSYFIGGGLSDSHVASVPAEPSRTATNYTLWVGNGWGHS